GLLGRARGLVGRLVLGRLLAAAAGLLQVHHPLRRRAGWLGGGASRVAVEQAHIIGAAAAGLPPAPGRGLGLLPLLGALGAPLLPPRLGLAHLVGVAARRLLPLGLPHRPQVVAEGSPARPPGGPPALELGF